MGEVIVFPNKDFKHCTYEEDPFKRIGVALKDGSLSVRPSGVGDEFHLTMGDYQASFEREELAEFLHITALYLDSERRSLKDFTEMIGMNY